MSTHEREVTFQVTPHGTFAGLLCAVGVGVAGMRIDSFDGTTGVFNPGLFGPGTPVDVIDGLWTMTFRSWIDYSDCVINGVVVPSSTYTTWGHEIGATAAGPYRGPANLDAGIDVQLVASSGWPSELMASVLTSSPGWHADASSYAVWDSIDYGTIYDLRVEEDELPPIFDVSVWTRPAAQRPAGLMNVVTDAAGQRLVAAPHVTGFGGTPASPSFTRNRRYYRRAVGGAWELALEEAVAGGLDPEAPYSERNGILLAPIGVGAGSADGGATWTAPTPPGWPTVAGKGVAAGLGSGDRFLLTTAGSGPGDAWEVTALVWAAAVDDGFETTVAEGVRPEHTGTEGVYPYICEWPDGQIEVGWVYDGEQVSYVSADAGQTWTLHREEALTGALVPHLASAGMAQGLDGRQVLVGYDVETLAVVATTRRRGQDAWGEFVEVAATDFCWPTVVQEPCGVWRCDWYLIAGWNEYAAADPAGVWSAV